MSRRSGGGDELVFLIIAAALTVVFLVWKFAVFLNVEFAASMRCIAGIAAATVFMVSFIKTGFELTRWSGSFFVSCFSLAAIPILDSWAAQAVEKHLLDSTPIYGTGYFQILMFALPLLVCWLYTIATE